MWRSTGSYNVYVYLSRWSLYHLKSIVQRLLYLHYIFFTVQRKAPGSHSGIFHRKECEKGERRKKWQYNAPEKHMALIALKPQKHSSRACRWKALSMEQFRLHSFSICRKHVTHRLIGQNFTEEAKSYRIIQTSESTIFMYILLLSLPLTRYF